MATLPEVSILPIPNRRGVLHLASEPTGAAARAAIPYVQSTLEEQAAIDLKPMASTARKSIEAAIADFQKQADGVKVEALGNRHPARGY